MVVTYAFGCMGAASESAIAASAVFTPSGSLASVPAASVSTQTTSTGDDGEVDDRRNDFDRQGGNLRRSPNRQQQQQYFFGLLQEADRRHQESLQRALDAERQVHQLRQVFQRWQQQLQQQQDAQDRVQLQVQRQLHALHDALSRQQLQAQQQLEEVYTFQQLQAFNHQQQLGQLQTQLFSLERDQCADRRNRQILQRLVRRTSRRWARGLALGASAEQYPQDDCCPCEYPEQCPINPCFPEQVSCATEIPEELSGGNCLLREIRLGLVESSSCADCKSQRGSLKQRRKPKRSFVESDVGYLADDEASLCSVSSSGHSSSFQEERRQLMLEVRSLKNTSMVPRYKQSWKPLRCFQCGEQGHLATVCKSETATTL